MNELQELRQSQPFQDLSLNKFARFAGVPYWKLRDHHKSCAERESKHMNQAELERLVKDMALKHPTFGYRRLVVELRRAGHQVSVHGVRKMLHQLKLNPAPVRKPRRLVPGVVPVHEWPTGRRVQIDATRLSLDDGIVWIYIVLDVLSRAVLAIKAVRALSMHSAKMALLEGVNELRA
jgi:transposase InsO family protein